MLIVISVKNNGQKYVFFEKNAHNKMTECSLNALAFLLVSLLKNRPKKDVICVGSPLKLTQKGEFHEKCGFVFDMLLKSFY